MNDIYFRSIDARNWEGYLSMYRRKIVKQPIQALGNGTVLVDFCKKLDDMATETYKLSDTADDFEPRPYLDICKQYLFDIMIKDAEIELRETIESNKTLLETTDLRIPHEWYPYARLMKRKIIYHGGPTNSGKTYQALQRLKNADPEIGLVL